MKIKKITYGEFRKRFNGLSRLKYDRKDMKFERSYGLESVRASFMYNKRKDCTYAMFTKGMIIDIGEPKDDYLAIVIRYEGKLDYDKFIEEHNDELSMIFEEISNWYDEYKKES